MTTSNAEPESISAGSGQALAAGISCYFIWGLMALVFQLMGRLGASPWEILAHRTLWGAPAGLVFVLWARQGRAALRLFGEPQTLCWLLLSAALIAANWSIFIWAVNSGRVLETSLGYYILPLINVAAGAVIFGERPDRAGLVAIGLAGAGVAMQTVALGHLPLVSLGLALSFGAYGVVRKRVRAEAQSGFLIECVFLAIPGLLFVLWLQAGGHGQFGRSLPLSLWLVACGPLTAIPLVLFAYAARRLPLSAMGFLQFIAPTMSFIMGVAEGEAFSPLRGLSFVLIWTGAAVFALAAWRKRRPAMAAAETSAAE